MGGGGCDGKKGGAWVLAWIRWRLYKSGNTQSTL